MWYLIDGINPEPWTAPEVGTTRRGGKVVPVVYKGEKSRVYQAAIKEHFEDSTVTPHTGELQVKFFFWRQVATYGGGHAQRVDATNLQKSTEDALQGILFANDRENRVVSSYIMDQGPKVDPAILIEVTAASLPTYAYDKLADMRKEIERPKDRQRSADTDELF